MTLKQVVYSGRFLDLPGGSSRTMGGLWEDHRRVLGSYFLPLEGLGGLANTPRVTKLYSAVCLLWTCWLPALSLLITKTTTAPLTHSLLLPAPVKAGGIIPTPSVSSYNDRGCRVQSTRLITKTALPLPTSAPPFAILSVPVTDV